MLNPNTHARAHYKTSPVSRYRGNPFIEALPSVLSKEKYLDNIKRIPKAPTEKTRKQSDTVRLMELPVLNEIILGFPEHQRAGLSLAQLLREPYVNRDPRTIDDVKRRTHMASSQSSEWSKISPHFKSTAKGHIFIGVTGMGKTTYFEAALFSSPQVIHHEFPTPNGEMKCVQVVYLALRCPHDGTLKSLCLQFFAQIDTILGTDYLREARGVSGIAEMVQLMHRVAYAVSLGTLVVDEVQNLRAASGQTAELMLNLFADIIEMVGVSLLVVGTPAIERVLEASARNIRKMSTTGETIFKPMTRGSIQWKNFTDAYWEFTFTKHKNPLTDVVRDAWYDACGGNSAFASLAFSLAQRDEIGGGREYVDDLSFDRVLRHRMTFLRPAINALVSGDRNQLLNFDDLVIRKDYEHLLELSGVTEDPSEPGSEAGDEQEFDEEKEINARDGAKLSKKRARRKPSKAAPEKRGNLPVEDPIAATSPEE
ncbi:MAG: ATP-binding protein [Hyphomicrobiales bacterium]|nr:MAG: ATP-binding protein [Hyphomicrobiales bacterium]